MAVSFICGLSKVSPRMANTIPRLELWAAMETAKSAQKVSKELDIPLHGVYFYTV